MLKAHYTNKTNQGFKQKRRIARTIASTPSPVLHVDITCTINIFVLVEYTFILSTFWDAATLYWAKSMHTYGIYQCAEKNMWVCVNEISTKQHNKPEYQKHSQEYLLLKSMA